MTKRGHLIFTDEHEDLRESMRAWVLKELTPHRNEWEETRWPDEVLRRAGDLGFLGLCFPEEYGGQGGDYLLLAGPCRVHELLGQRRPQHGLRGPDRHGAPADPPARHRGDLKRRYLGPGIKGEKIGCLGITEPGAGSDVAGIRTTAICATATST